MIKNNLLLEKMNDKVRTHNENAKKNLEEVAMLQNLITILYVLFTVLAFLLIDFLLGGENDLFKGVSNKVLSLIASIVLLIPSFPLATKVLKSKKRKFDLNLNEIEPTFDYNGKWSYFTRFKVMSKNDGSKDFEVLYNNMNGFNEEGTSQWSQKALEINIEHAYTDEMAKSADEGTIPQVVWESSPVVFAKNTIEWYFSGEIKWKGDDTIANNFSGVETYDVVEHDATGRPSVLKGLLRGTIHVGEHYYVVEAYSDFNRISY